jgi:hypothetical protein
MQRAQSAAFTSAVERFGAAAQALTCEDVSLDEVVRACGATTPVDPRPAELAVVRHLSGFTEDGAMRVLALRERLLELRECSSVNVATSCVFFQVACSDALPKDARGCRPSTP